MEDDSLLVTPVHFKPLLHTTPADEPAKENVDREGSADESEGEQDEEESNCPICFEPWTSSGRHRIVSLKCGHLFGRSCIEKWLCHGPSGSSLQPSSSSKCPQCNAPARRADVRVLFVAKRIVAVDTDGREQLLRALEEERRGKRLALDREAAATMQLQVARAELIRLKEELAQAKLQHIFSTLPVQRPRYAFLRQLSLVPLTVAGPDGAGSCCRCLHIDWHYRVAVIARTLSGPSHGLARVSLGECLGLSSSAPSLQSASFLPALQDRPIRAVAGSYFRDGLVAAVGLGSRLHLASLQSGAVVAEWGLSAPGWSVSFDRRDRNLIYAGLGNRRLAVFDIRQTRSALRESVPVDAGSPPLPVHSLHSGFIDGDTGMRFVVGATMNGVFVSSIDADFAALSHPSESSKDTAGTLSSSSSGLLLHTVRLAGAEGGACSGLAAAPDGTARLLASFRQAEPDRPARMVYFSLAPAETAHGSVYSVQSEQTFDAVSGSSRLLRPLLLNDHPREPARLSAAVIDEPTSAVHLWDLWDKPDSPESPTGPRDRLSCNTARPLVDLGFCPGGSGSDTPGLLLALSDQQLFMYKGGLTI